MIVVTNLEYYEAEGTIHEIQHMHQRDHVHVKYNNNEYDSLSAPEVQRDIIESFHLVTAKGEHILLALDKEISELLGVSCTALRNTQHQLSLSQEEVRSLSLKYAISQTKKQKLQQELDAIKSANMWTRIKWVLGGVK